jgi:hypothetical protein
MLPGSRDSADGAGIAGTIPVALRQPPCRGALWPEDCKAVMEIERQEAA